MQKFLSFCLALALISTAWAQTYSFTTIAGRPPLTGSVDGVGSEARFNGPFATAVDSAGNVYVPDVNAHIIRKITPAGVVTTLAGKAGERGSADGVGSAARFNTPQAVAVDEAGNVYVADYGNSVIRKISSTSAVTTFAGTAGAPGSADGTGSSARFNAPGALAVDAEGNVFVTDWLNRNIRKITSAGVVSTIAGQAGVSGSTDGVGLNARFGNTGGIAIDSAGNLYVADTNNHTIRKITSAGQVSTLAGAVGTSGLTNGVGVAARFNRPYGLTVNAQGNLFVVDTLNYAIRSIAPDGTVTTFAGTNGIRGSKNGTGNNARFFRPIGVAVDRNGNFFVADYGNQTIRKITSAGAVSDFAGPGGGFGSTDGTGSTARFDFPGGIALNGNGDILIADTGNFSLRKSTPTGLVSTVIGSNGTLGYADGDLSVAKIGYPSAVNVDPSGNIYIADAVYDVIRRISPDNRVATFAGSPDQSGAVDATGTAARFNRPGGVATDRIGNIYVADTSNHTIRKINSSGGVTTLAGLAGTSGTANGVGSAARFFSPYGIAVDAAGTVFVADSSNHAIRKIAPDGTVTTLAGLPGTSGSVNGFGSAARFLFPFALCLDESGNVFVADADNYAVRKITPDGTVTTVGGLLGTSGSADGTGSNARFGNPTAIAMTNNGVLFIMDGGNNALIRGDIDRVPTFTIQPQTLSVTAGSSVVLSASATGGGLSYQWKLNGVAVSGATGPTLVLPSVQSSVTGTYTLEVSNSAGSITSSPSVVSISNTLDFGRIINLSIRAQAGSGAQTLIVGLAVGGSGTTGTKPILIRGVGPTLSQYQVPDFLQDPRLSVFQGSNVVDSNDNWEGSAQITNIVSQVGAFSYASATSKDAAIYNSGFTNNTYTVQITGAGGASGVALAEIYDASPAGSFTLSTPRLVNVSARTQVGTGGNILIAGFVIGGSTAKTLLIRATGPALDQYGVLGFLTDPKLDVIRSDSGVVVARNDDWGGDATLVNASASVGAFSLSSASKDAAVLITLPPGSYSAQVAGVSDTTGVGLIEVYEVP